MSSFDTPQRQFVDVTKVENNYRGTVTPDITSLTDKLSEANFTPSKRIPLGLMFETNRGVLASGAQRVLVKEKEVVKTPKSANRGKTNFMKPTEAYRNYVPSTTLSKSPKVITTPAPTSTVKTTSASSGSAAQVNSANKVKVSTPSSVMNRVGVVQGTPQHQALTTPVRNVIPSTRSTSTPPSTRRPSSDQKTQQLSSKKTTPVDDAKRRFDSPKRVMTAPAPSSASHQSSAHAILFSPPRGNSTAVDDTILSEDVQLVTPLRSHSNPRPSSRPSLGSDGGVAPHRIEFKMAMDSNDNLPRKPAIPIFEMKPKTPKTPEVTVTVTKKAATPTQQQISPVLPSRNSESNMSTGVTPATPSSAGKSSARPLNHAGSASKLSLFKNPGPTSHIVTTADTLSANKAAKKAVNASLFKPPPPPNVTYHYSAPTASSSAAVNPNQNADKNLNGTPSRKAKSSVSDAVAPLDSPEGTTASTAFGAAKSSLAQKNSATKKTPKKAKKVTIAVSSPTILSVASLPPPPPQSYLNQPFDNVDIDVDKVLNTIESSGMSERGLSEDVDSSRFSSQSPYNANQEYDMRRSMSFGSELSSVRGFPESDMSLADTIDLSNNTSLNDHNIAPSPYEGMISSTPVSAITHNSHSSSVGQSRSLRNAETLARMQLDENLLNVSVVEPALSYSPSQHSGISFGSLSAFTPIPPSHLLPNRKPTRHHHNTATVTSRSSEYSNFYAQYGEGPFGIPNLNRSHSNTQQSNSILRMSNKALSSSSAMSPLTPYSTTGGAFTFSRQASLNNDSILEDVNEDNVSLASSNILNRGMILNNPSCSFSVASEATTTDLMLNISNCGSLVSSFNPLTPSNAVNTGMMMTLGSESGTVSDSPLKISMSNSLLSGASSMLNTAVSAHNVLNTGMFNLEDSECVSPSKEMIFNRPHLFSADSQGMSTINSSTVAMMNKSIKINGNDIHCVELESEIELDETEDAEVEPVFIIDDVAITASAFAGSSLNDNSESAAAIVFDEQIAHSSGDEPNMGSGGGVSEDSMQNAMNFVDNLEFDSQGEPFVPKQIDSNPIDDDVSSEDFKSFEFSEHLSEDNDMVMLSDPEDEVSPQEFSEDVIDEGLNQSTDSFDDNLEPEVSLPVLDTSGMPPRAFIEESTILVQETSASSVDSIEQYVPKSSHLNLDCPPNVSDSLEFKPRSLSRLPVPAPMAPLTPVTKSYLDIERTVRNQQSASPRKVVSHLDFEDYQTVDAFNQDTIEDLSNDDFVSTLPMVPMQLPPSQVVYQQDSLDLSHTNNRSMMSGVPQANTSFISINTSGYNSSLCSHTSSMDELQHLNPRIKSSQWVATHYHSSSMSLRTRLGENEPTHSETSFQPREDVHLSCPDPVANQLTKDSTGKDFKPVSANFKS